MCLACNFDKAIDFSKGFINIQSSSSLPSGNSDRTISFWLYLPSNADTVSEYTAVYIGSDTCSYGAEFTIEVKAGDIIAIDSCNLGTFYFSSLKLVRNNWNFVVVTLQQGNQATVYVNNVNNKETKTITGSLNTVPIYVRFGSRLVTNTYANAGLMDDIRIWNRVISLSEMETVKRFQLVSYGLVSSWDGSTVTQFNQIRLKDIIGNNNGVLSASGLLVDTCKKGKKKKYFFYFQLNFLQFVHLINLLTSQRDMLNSLHLPLFYHLEIAIEQYLFGYTCLLMQILPLNTLLSILEELLVLLVKNL